MKTLNQQLICYLKRNKSVKNPCSMTETNCLAHHRCISSFKFRSTQVNMDEQLPEGDISKKKKRDKKK